MTHSALAVCVKTLLNRPVEGAGVAHDKPGGHGLGFATLPVCFSNARWLQSFYMSLFSIDVIGSLAAVLTTVSFVPQAWKTWRTRDVSGISLVMYSVFTTGVGLWLVYGWMLGALPIIVANAITFALALLILGMRIRYGRAAVGD